MVDDLELERAMREGLERRAREVELAVPVVARATGAVRRRHRAGLAVGFAAASVAAVVAGAAINSSPPEPEVGGLQPADERPDEWRTEYWADVRVDVPADWGYGRAPLSNLSRSCQQGATVDVSGEPLNLDDQVTGYVGRPVVASDTFTCVGTWERPDPLVPYVWLGSDLRAGAVDLGDGFVRETIQVNGSTVTVGSHDDELRRMILESASGGEVCLSEIESGGAIGHDAAQAGAEPTAMNVCVYRQLDGSESASTLIYADRVAGDSVASYREELERTPTPTDLCPTIDYVESAWVVLELVTDDGSVVDQDVVHLGVCPGIALDPQGLGGLERVPVTPELARPWLQGGIRAVVSQEALGLHR